MHEFGYRRFKNNSPKQHLPDFKHTRATCTISQKSKRHATNIVNFKKCSETTRVPTHVMFACTRVRRTYVRTQVRAYLRMCVCARVLLHAFPIKQHMRARRTEITPRRFGNYSTDSQRNCNAKAIGGNIAAFITPRTRLNYSTVCSPRPTFSIIPCSPLGGGNIFRRIEI